MYFARYGNGDEIFVGLHGWSGDHRTFLSLIPYLPPTVTFFSADLPGTGKSDAPNSWTLDAYIQKISQALLNLKVRRLTILGSCSGGLIGLFIAQWFAKHDYPDLVKRIILIDPYAYFPWYFSTFVSPRMGKIGWYAYCVTFANPLGRWATNLSLKKHRVANTSLTNSFAETNHFATYQQLRLLVEGGDSKQFNKLTQSIDVVYGHKTFGAVKKSIYIWKTIFQNAKYYELQNAAHLPIEEATAELASIVFPRLD